MRYAKTGTITVPNPYAPSYRVYYGRRSGYIQKPRTESPNAFELERSAATRPDLWNAYVDAPNSSMAYNAKSPTTEGVIKGNWGRRQADTALNRCYYKFKDQVYTESASFGVNAAEYKQTVDMIADDAVVLRKAWNSLRRGNLREFKRLLRIAQKRGESPWSRPDLAGSLWLQYHFGWEPLVKDIHDGLKVLEADYPSRKIAAFASAKGSYYSTKNYSAWNYEVPEFSYRVRMGAIMDVINPNLHRATALGLTNPLTIAWEVVPFSFVVDWFWPIGQFLDSWSDFAGLSFRDPFTTRSNKCFGHQYVRNSLTYGGGISANNWQAIRAHYMIRTLAIEGPVFPWPKSFKGFSVARGATAIALLVGALSSERKFFTQTAGDRFRSLH